MSYRKFGCNYITEVVKYLLCKHGLETIKNNFFLVYFTVAETRF